MVNDLSDDAHYEDVAEAFGGPQAPTFERFAHRFLEIRDLHADLAAGEHSDFYRQVLERIDVDVSGDYMALKKLRRSPQKRARAALLARIRRAHRNSGLLLELMNEVITAKQEMHQAALQRVSHHRSDNVRYQERLQEERRRVRKGYRKMMQRVVERESARLDDEGDIETSEADPLSVEPAIGADQMFPTVRRPAFGYRPAASLRRLPFGYPLRRRQEEIIEEQKQ